MLEEAVHELRGEPVVHDVDPELSFDVAALLPEDYVGDVGVRLSLYKRLASAIDEASVGEIAEEMEERFGSPPEEARRLVQLDDAQDRASPYEGSGLRGDGEEASLSTFATTRRSIRRKSSISCARRRAHTA